MTITDTNFTQPGATTQPTFDQVSPLGELTVRWTGAEDADIEITDEFDGAPPEADAEQQTDEETT